MNMIYYINKSKEVICMTTKRKLQEIYATMRLEHMILSTETRNLIYCVLDGTMSKSAARKEIITQNLKDVKKEDNLNV